MLFSLESQESYLSRDLSTSDLGNKSTVIISFLLCTEIKQEATLLVKKNNNKLLEHLTLIGTNFSYFQFKTRRDKDT